MKTVLRQLVRFALVTSLLSGIFGLLFLRGNVSALSDSLFFSSFLSCTGRLLAS